VSVADTALTASSESTDAVFTSVPLALALTCTGTEMGAGELPAGTGELAVLAQLTSVAVEAEQSANVRVRARQGARISPRRAQERSEVGHRPEVREPVGIDDRIDPDDLAAGDVERHPLLSVEGLDDPARAGMSEGSSPA
jgi:hypothetical protein